MLPPAKKPFDSGLRLLTCLLSLGLACATGLRAAEIRGKVLNETYQPVPFASVFVKGSTTGTTANADGEYRLELPPGRYTVVCQHVGYVRAEKEAVLREGTLFLNFVMKEQQLTMAEVVVRPGGEDPAYAIIREAIAKRDYHRRQVEAYTCKVYLKGMLKLRSFPKSFLGQPIDLQDGDTGRGPRIAYLSETVARYSFRQPDKRNVEVLSTRVSGRSDAFGFGSPQVFSFYEENVRLSDALNPRGFLSPIADNALQFYRYRYLGAFFEEGRQVNRIQVIPKRRYEPLFKGYVNIVEDEWNIHSLDLTLDKESQMQFVERLGIRQVYLPVGRDAWMLQTQQIFPSLRQFGFDAEGHFTSVFSEYTLEPAFRKGFFGRTLIRYDSLSNRRPRAYWDSIRPLPLLEEELLDFRRKDSLEEERNDPAYLDSLDRIRNRITPVGFLLNGQTLQRRSRGLSFSYDPFLTTAGFNTVEGWMLRLSGDLVKQLKGRDRLTVSPVIRYGFGNGRLNPSLGIAYRFGKPFASNLQLSAGRRVLQFNTAGPVSQFQNTTNSLLFSHNYMKLFEAGFATIRLSKSLGGGLSFTAELDYQSRRPLENTDTLTFWGPRRYEGAYTANRAVETGLPNIPYHRALVAGLTLRYRPGARYVELPDRTFSVGSKYPLFTLSLQRGLPELLGSEVAFTRWSVNIDDELNLRLAGELKYRIAIGGFTDRSRLQLPDYRHFNGNLLLSAAPYLNSFQLMPYYAYANTAAFCTELHVEHHFNGAITNKIPFVKRLNLQLVAGANALHIDRGRRYAEAFIGIDNILKVFRLDYIRAFDADGPYDSGLRLGIKVFNSLTRGN